MTKTYSREERYAIAKTIFSKDIESFGKFFFPNHMKNDTPDFHREIFSAYENTDLKRIAFGAPRGHAKSTITDLVYLAWEIVHAKRKFVLLVSDTYSQAVMFLDTLKAELEDNDKLKAFYGVNGVLMSDTWSEGEIVSNGVMVKAFGAGMKVRGLKYRESRPDLIIVDDLENDELVENKERRDKLERWFSGALVPSLDRDGRLIMIGTILHYDSLMAKMLSEDKYTDYFKKTYKAIEDGKALWPAHLSIEQLEKIRREYSENGYAYLFYQEYQNDPISDDNRKFRIEKMRYYEEKELDKKNLRCFITIDRAYSKEKTADATGIIINRVDNDNNWYIISEKFKGTESELIEKIFDLKNHFKPIKIGIEQKAFEYTIKPALKEAMMRRNSFFSVEELKDGGTSKNRRIEGLLPRHEMGTIYLRRQDTDLVDEMIRFPKGAHDDLIDSLAYQLVIANTPVVRREADNNGDLKMFDYFRKEKASRYFTGSVYLRR